MKKKWAVSLVLTRVTEGSVVLAQYLTQVEAETEEDAIGIARVEAFRKNKEIGQMKIHFKGAIEIK